MWWYQSFLGWRKDSGNFSRTLYSISDHLNTLCRDWEWLPTTIKYLSRRRIVYHIKFGYIWPTHILLSNLTLSWLHFWVQETCCIHKKHVINTSSPPKSNENCFEHYRIIWNYLQIFPKVARATPSATIQPMQWTDSGTSHIHFDTSNFWNHNWLCGDIKGS